MLTWIIHKKWMKDENMLKKKDFDDAAVVAALRRYGEDVGKDFTLSRLQYFAISL